MAVGGPDWSPAIRWALRLSRPSAGLLGHGTGRSPTVQRGRRFGRTRRKDLFEFRPPLAARRARQKHGLRVWVAVERHPSGLIQAGPRVVAPRLVVGRPEPPGIVDRPRQARHPVFGTPFRAKGARAVRAGEGGRGGGQRCQAQRPAHIEGEKGGGGRSEGYKIDGGQLRGWNGSGRLDFEGRGSGCNRGPSRETGRSARAPTARARCSF